MVRRFLLLSLVTAAFLAAGSPGIRPRAAVGDYPSHQSVDAAAFGAALVRAGEAKKIFGSDLAGAGYIVIEVGVFPAPGRTLDLSPLDFTLLTDPTSISERTADADVIASAAAGKRQRTTSETESSQVSVTTGAAIQHESYPGPATGRKVGVTTTSIGSGVGVSTPADGRPLPASGGADRDRLERELPDKSLPDGTIAGAAAGYLYFPKPSKKSKSNAWTLRWENASGHVELVLPNK